MEGPDRADAVFSALADATRREVVRQLAEDGPATATELAGRLPVTRQAVAKHLGALGEAGLVTGERTGRGVEFRLTPEPLGDAMAWIVEVGGRWDRRRDALRRHHETPPA
jgi:DNA-binding transcriptional ArsR family regulator